MDKAEKLKNDIKEYSQKRHKYEAYTKVLHTLIQSLLDESDISYHTIECRTKSTDSFAEKLQRKDKFYADPIKQITDLSAIRIIANNLEEASSICKILEAEFIIDADNSEDKGKLLKPHEVGYLSTHYIINLTKNREALKEYNAYESMVAEVQVRTVLQHAWSIINHKISYKAEIELQTEMQRRLFLLSGLLELADREFSEIISSTKSKNVENIDLNAQDAETIGISFPTLLSALTRSSEFAEYDQLALSQGLLGGVHEGRDLKDMEKAFSNWKINTPSKAIDQVTWSIQNIDLYKEFLAEVYGFAPRLTIYGCIEQNVILRNRKNVHLDFIKTMYFNGLPEKIMSTLEKL